MGLHLWRHQGACRIYRVSADGLLGVCQSGGGARGTPYAGQQSNVILTIVTDSVDGWYRRLLDRGATFQQPPEINPRFAIYHCFLRDPDGYLIEIQSFMADSTKDRTPD